MHTLEMPTLFSLHVHDGKCYGINFNNTVT